MCQTLLSDNTKQTTGLRMIDHTPESEEDEEEIKKERRERTTTYMDLLCSDWKKRMKHAMLNVPPEQASILTEVESLKVTVSLQDSNEYSNARKSLHSLHQSFRFH
jgi:hypothetical protein